MRGHSPDGVSPWTSIKASAVTVVALFVAVTFVMVSLVLLAVAALVVAIVGLVTGRRRDIRLGRWLVIEIAPSHQYADNCTEGEARR